MKLFSILLVFILFFSSFVESNNDSALRECGNLHHLEFKNIPNAEAFYTNENCALKCAVGNTTLSNDAINEGFPCPLDINGVCKDGHCIIENPHIEAFRECGSLLNIDFLKSGGNHVGTTYLNDQCMLRCVVSGQVVLQNTINEGYSCLNGEVNGTCRNGHCQEDAHTEIPTTHAPTTPITPSIFTTHKIKYFLLSILSGNLSQSYTGLSAIGCVGKKFNPDIRFSACYDICGTRQISTETSNPQFNSTNCRLYSQLVNDHLHVEVLHANYVIGLVILNLRSLFEHNYYGNRYGVHSFVFEHDFPIRNHEMVRMGSLDLKFDVKLEPIHTIG